MTHWRASAARSLRTRWPGWGSYKIIVQNLAVLTREFANLDRAANQALSESIAWQDGLRLVVALWPFIEWHGYWLAWRAVLARALAVCRRLGDLTVEVEITDQLGELARTWAKTEPPWTGRNKRCGWRVG